MGKLHKKRRCTQRGRKGYLWFILFNGAPVGECCICHQPLTFDEATVEHLIPLSKGGSDKISSGNINVSHPGCNHGRDHDAKVISNSYEMAQKLLEMCTGKRQVPPRWGGVINRLLAAGDVTFEKCRTAYLERKGVVPQDPTQDEPCSS